MAGWVRKNRSEPTLNIFSPVKQVVPKQACSLTLATISSVCPLDSPTGLKTLICMLFQHKLFKQHDWFPV